MRDALRQRQKEKAEYHRRAIEKLNAQYAKLQNRIDQIYLDKLDGEMEDAFYRRNVSLWREEQAQIRPGSSATRRRTRTTSSRESGCWSSRGTLRNSSAPTARRSARRSLPSFYRAQSSTGTGWSRSSSLRSTSFTE